MKKVSDEESQKRVAYEISVSKLEIQRKNEDMAVSGSFDEDVCIL